jgi:hypothetical protein
VAQPVLVGLADALAATVERVTHHLHALLVGEVERVLAEHVLRAVAENLGHARVHEARPVVGVEHPDALRGRLDDAPVALLALGKRVLRVAALREVANEAGEQHRVLLRAADRQLDRELTPVGAHRGQLGSLAEQARRGPGDDALEALPVSLAQPRRHDQLAQRPAEHHVPGVAEDPLGGRVELGDPALAVHADDGVERAGDHRPLRREQLLQLGQVDHAAHRVERRPVVVAQEGHVEPDPARLAAGGHEPLLHVVRGDLAAEQLPAKVERELAVVGVGDVERLPLAQLVLGVTNQIAKRLVHDHELARGAAPGLGHAERYRRVVDGLEEGVA